MNDTPPRMETSEPAVDWPQKQTELEAGLIQVFPEMMEPVAVIFGHRMPLSRKSVQAIASQMAEMLTTFARRAVEAENTDDPQGQQLLAFADMIRGQLPEIPPGADVFQYLAAESRRVLDTWIELAPPSYRERHELYREFLMDVVIQRGFDAVETFLTEIKMGLLPQYQNMEWALRLPTELRREPRRLTTARVRRYFTEWQTIASDWDKWTRLSYGLLRLYQGESIMTWEQAGRVKLHDRILALTEHPKLAALTCQGEKSVTIRNALAHGDALHNPQTRCAEFIDGRRIPMKVTVKEEAVRTQVIDMALSNRAMFLTQWLVNDIRYDVIRRRTAGETS